MYGLHNDFKGSFFFLYRTDLRCGPERLRPWEGSKSMKLQTEGNFCAMPALILVQKAGLDLEPKDIFVPVLQ